MSIEDQRRSKRKEKNAGKENERDDNGATSEEAESSTGNMARV